MTIYIEDIEREISAHIEHLKETIQDCKEILREIDSDGLGPQLAYEIQCYFSPIPGRTLNKIQSDTISGYAQEFRKQLKKG